MAPGDRWLVAVAAASVFAIAAPGLGEHGLLTEIELAVLDRADAALGQARSGLERAPIVGEWLRARSYGAIGGELGLRLPHLFATVITAGLTVALARLRGCTTTTAALAAVMFVSMPAVAVGARTVSGNPFGECFATAAIVAGLAAGGATGPRRMALVAAALLALAAAIGSQGLLLAGVIPLVAITALGESLPARWRTTVAIAAALATVAVVVLVAGQADGYIPLLGAAKDLELMDKPEGRRFTAGLVDLGHQAFPWLPLALLGAAVGRDRGLGLWIGLGLAAICAWSLQYGVVDLPLRVPVAIAAAVAVATLGDGTRPLALRRAVAILGALAVVVVAKDLDLAPEQIAVPDHVFGVNDYPATELRTAAQLGRLVKLLALALLAGLVIAPRPSDATSRVRALLLRLGPATRSLAPTALVGLVALGGAVLHMRVLVPQTADKLSPKRVLGVYARLAAQDDPPRALATHRVRDRALVLYGPAGTENLPGRRDVFTYLAAEEPRYALLRDLDVAAVHQQHRQAGLPMYVLDDSHAHLRLLSNELPSDMVDRNRISEVLADSPFELENPTFVRFEDYLEVVGWEVDGPIVRGRHHTLKLSLRVLKPLPGGAKMLARFVGGRLSRINGDPQPLAEDLYPCNLWRAGDFILHRFEFDAPLFEILPGSYDFVIGLRRGESKNFSISGPEGKTGEYGVRIDDPKRAFAVIGTVEVW